MNSPRISLILLTRSITDTLNPTEERSDHCFELSLENQSIGAEIRRRLQGMKGIMGWCTRNVNEFLVRFIRSSVLFVYFTAPIMRVMRTCAMHFLPGRNACHFKRKRSTQKYDAILGIKWLTLVHHHGMRRASPLKEERGGLKGENRIRNIDLTKRSSEAL